MPRARTEPERTCVACRAKGGKRELIRVVRRPDGRVHSDPSGKAPGRGAYLHRDDTTDWANDSDTGGGAADDSGRWEAGVATAYDDDDSRYGWVDAPATWESDPEEGWDDLAAWFAALGRAWSLGLRLALPRLSVQLSAFSPGGHYDAHRDAIRDSLAAALGSVNVKFTTGEKMGFVGREEGAAALAVATLEAIGP